MKKCRKCSVEVDNKSIKCPNCQADLRNSLNRHPIVVVTLFILLIVWFAYMFSKSDDKKSVSTSNTTGEKQVVVPPPRAILTTTKELVTAFDKNKLAAENQYKNSYVEFTAKIKNISTDISNTPYLSLEPLNSDKYYYGTTLKCDFKSKESLITLENGNNVKLRGIITGMSVGIITLDDCLVVSN